MKLMNILYLLLALAATALTGWLVYAWSSAPDADRAKVEPAKIKNIQEMAQLCTTEIYEDVPIRGRIGTRHIFARMTVNGSISFPLDSTSIHTGHDTIVVTLPRERVEILESTVPGSYQVIDTWNDSFLGSSNFTTAEENKIKDMIRARLVQNLYRSGTVKRARADAAENLKSLISASTGRPVTVNY